MTQSDTQTKSIKQHETWITQDTHTCLPNTNEYERMPNATQEGRKWINIEETVRITHNAGNITSEEMS